MTALGSLTLAQVKRYLEVSGADVEAEGVLGVKGLEGLSTKEQHGYPRIDVSKLKEELLHERERERSYKISMLRAKQKQIIADKEGRQEELLELQQAEEVHHEGLLREREERKKIAKELHSLQRSHLMNLEAETVRELEALQREKENFLEKEKKSREVIAEVRQHMMAQDLMYQKVVDKATRNLEERKIGRNSTFNERARLDQDAIESEQVNLAKEHGTRAGVLKVERDILHRELRDVQGRIEKVRGGGEASLSQVSEDALSALLNDAGLQCQVARLQKLKVDYEVERSEAVQGNYLKEYEQAEEKTRKQLSTQEVKTQQIKEEYTEANANAFLDEWLKGDEKSSAQKGSNKPSPASMKCAPVNKAPERHINGDDGSRDRDNNQTVEERSTNSLEGRKSESMFNDTSQSQNERSCATSGHGRDEHHISHGQGRMRHDLHNHRHGKHHDHVSGQCRYHRTHHKDHHHSTCHAGYNKVHHDRHDHDPIEDKGKCSHQGIMKRRKIESDEWGARGGSPNCPRNCKKNEKLEETVLRLEAELQAIKSGQAATGDQIGVGAGMQTTNGRPEGAGGGDVRYFHQYIAALDAENARMQAELQGMDFRTRGSATEALGIPVPPLPTAVGTGNPIVGCSVQAQYLMGVGGDTKKTPENDDKTEVDHQQNRMRMESDAPVTSEQEKKMTAMTAKHKARGWGGTTWSEEVKKLEFEMERLELEQQLEDMRECMAREKKSKQRDVAHEQWVAEQARNLQAIKIQK
ncbi:unnamed protein product, partial [Choristocarpus tenellus]